MYRVRGNSDIKLVKGGIPKSLKGTDNIKLTKKQEKVIEKTEKNAAIFGKEYRKLKKMIGSNNKNFQGDKAIVAMLRAMLTSTLKMIPTAEYQYHLYKNERAAYAYSALINQAREIANDIRNVQNLEQQVDKIMDDIVKPSFSLIVQHLVEELDNSGKKLYKEVENKAIVKKILKRSARNIGRYITEHTASIENQLKKYLVDRK